MKLFIKIFIHPKETFQSEACDLFVRNLEIPTLRDEERDNLEGPLTYDECRKALETFQNDKAPGEDGFTIEFYKYFFDLLGNDLLASFNEAHAKGELSISQRRGIITLTPKEDGSLLGLSNWRPITLLNVDLKIAAKAIAKRLEPMFATLIHPDQTGFVKGRYIGENIRLINDVMEIAKTQNLPGILTSLDFRKAFDSLEWPFIMKTLDYFNFGTDMKRWVSTFYSNIESTVVNNGNRTNWFNRLKEYVRAVHSLPTSIFYQPNCLLIKSVRTQP